jgi:pSer/pThr/pTyr-binding forkhead associated (FHA) protein
MAIRLQVTPTAAAAGADGSKPGAQELRLDGDTIVIGREKSCDVALSEQSVSRNHARITRDGSLYFVEDLGSAFGTRVNGQLLPKAEKRLLRNGDVIAVGTFDIAFSRALEATQPRDDGAESTNAVARAVVKDALRGLAGEGTPYFRVMNGPLEGRHFEMSEATELVVGRQDTCEIVLDDDLTSRRHAKLRRDWSGTHVEDLGSRNGVKVNRKLIQEPTTLKDRDEVEIGGTRLLYVDSTSVAELQVVPSIIESDPPEAPPRAAPTAEPPRTSAPPRPVPSRPPIPEPKSAPVPAPAPEPEPEPEESPAEDDASQNQAPGLGDDAPEGTEVEVVPKVSLRDRLPRDRASVLRALPFVVVGVVVIALLVALVLILV